MAMHQWPESDAAALLIGAPWQTVVNLLAHMNAAACKSPCQIGALRRIVQEHLYPRVRRATVAHPMPMLVRTVVACLQAWLVAGILQTPVAVRGTGFFAACATHARHATNTQHTAMHANSFLSKERVTEADARACYICGDRLAIVFDDGVNAWVYADAVRASDALVHEDCIMNCAECGKL